MMFDVLDGALGSMKRGPRPLAPALTFSAGSNLDDPALFDQPALYRHLATRPAADEASTLIRRYLARWDNESGDWAGETGKNTQDRRRRIYDLLVLDAPWIELLDRQFPFHPLEPATVIATEHRVWYSDEHKRAQDFYWQAYLGQLRRNGWGEASLNQLDESTSSVVERLSDPGAEGAYQSKGLVVGYVQSGKTANFTGVIARAADAGYKFIIVLGGTLDVLRSQTQRRIDKEMIGRPLVDDYADDADWDDFLQHSARPSQLGSFDWYRLTGPEDDYRGLERGVGALKFEAHDPSKPLWNRDNLQKTQTCIAVVKKNSKVLEKLLADLRQLRRMNLGAPFDQIPTLIIDDESDQASINVKKKAAPGDEQERTATNKAIVSLLKLFPRAQYVGYTATPFANVFVDPNNEEDIFPKDFLISLPRPADYMGVAQFYDLDGSDSDPESRPNERDYVRAVKGEDTAPENLQRAIDAFVLSGALKLFRTSEDPTLKFRHHTMLAHLSPRVADHKDLAEMVRDIYGKAGYDGGDGLDRLQALFKDDFERVWQRRGEEHGRQLPFPGHFEDLLPFIGDCLTEIGDSRQAVLTINNEHKAETPDFDRKRTWKILVGGTKLSRGYTVEGLTVSYYRRSTGAADTLMQMGRWFGFRKGYRDLVRLFIGTEEGKKKVNLYEAFGGVCRDEELFREELKRYAEMTSPRITPAQIPPLVPQHMLRPTAANKMYNAVVTNKNFGNQLSESTYAPTEANDSRANDLALKALIGSAKAEPVSLGAEIRDRPKTLDANVLVLKPKDVIAFLKAYRWFNTKDPAAFNPMQLQVEFLEKKSGDPEIDDWLLLGPKIRSPLGSHALAGLDFDVVHRSRDSEAKGRFNTYNDPFHRAFAQFISGQRDLSSANQALQDLRKPRRAVMIYYPVTEAVVAKSAKAPFTTAFTLLFPPNRIATPIAFTVHRKEAKDSPVVAVAS